MGVRSHAKSESKQMGETRGVGKGQSREVGFHVNLDVNGDEIQLTFDLIEFLSIGKKKKRRGQG